MEIAHLALYTRDLEGLRAFYMRLLGASSSGRYRSESGSGMESYFLAFGGGARLELMTLPRLEDRLPGGRVGLAHFAVRAQGREGVEALTGRAAAAGCPALSPPRRLDSGDWLGLLADPEGNRFEVTSRGTATLEHVALHSRDLDRLERFYRDYFGGVRDARGHTPEGAELRFLSFGEGTRLELARPSPPPDGPGPGSARLGLAHLCLSVGGREAVDALTARIAGDGHPLLGACRTTGDGYYESVVADPDGNRVEITA